MDHIDERWLDPQKTDLRWIRWTGLRMDFVDAMFKAAKHKSDDGSIDPMCNKKSCCADLVEIAPAVGISLFFMDNDDSAIVHASMDYMNSRQAQPTDVMRDALSMLKYMYWGRDLSRSNPFEGYLEAPRFIAQLMGNDYFNAGWSKNQEHPRQVPNRDEYVRDFVYALAYAAFPDTYLNSLYEVDLNPIEVKKNEFEKTFNEFGLIAPLLTDRMYEDLDLDSLTTSQFGHDENKWSIGASYLLELGMKDASLEKYWETPRRWDAFEFFERSNGYSTCHGMIVSSPAVFVNQQTFSQQTNELMAAFNEYMAPVLDVTPTIPGAMVIVSTFRSSAYILSAAEETWDEYAPSNKVFGPIPSGMGIVGVWRNYDKDRYTPRNLDEIAKMRNPFVSAAAMYLKECLRVFPELGE